MTDADLGDRHPATTGLLRWFEYEHLPPHLQAISRPCRALAYEMVAELPDGPELTTGLRKLLEAKDCLVRAAIDAVQTRSAANPGPRGRERLVRPDRCSDVAVLSGVQRRCDLDAGHDGVHGTLDDGKVWA